MDMNELSESIRNDREIFTKAIRRARNSGVEIAELCNVVVFLEKEIDMYRDKIEKLFDKKEKLKTRLTAVYDTSQFNASVENEAAQISTTAEIIKALADNGYNTITINCYKDNESEE